MGYIVAFLIFLLIINLLGFLFSIALPLIFVVVVMVAVLNLLGYNKRKKDYQKYHEDDKQFYRQDQHENKQNNTSYDDVIDVEFSETDIDEK